MSNTLSHVEFAQAYEQWKNRGWDSSVQAFAVQIEDIPNRKRIDWLNNSEIAYDRLVSIEPDRFIEQLFSGEYDDDIELWLHPELAEVVPEPDVDDIVIDDIVIDDYDFSLDTPEPELRGASYLDN